MKQLKKIERNPETHIKEKHKHRLENDVPN